jgi:hypothetical protein
MPCVVMPCVSCGMPPRLFDNHESVTQNGEQTRDVDYVGDLPVVKAFQNGAPLRIDKKTGHHTSDCE